MRVVALIPAHNEQGRVGAVVDVVRRAAGLAAVIVVDDGSTDGTAAEARAAGAEVLSLSPNRGKGGAMRAALHDPRVAASSHALFLDADLLGLRPDHVERLVALARDPNVAMALGDRDYGVLDPIVAALPAITGERVVRRDVLAAVHPDDWQGFRIEAGLNEAARRVGGLVVRTPLDGVSVVAKWQKTQNPVEGVRSAALMLREVLAAMAEARARVRTPPPAPFTVDCIVPAYNEAGRIQSVLSTLQRTRGITRLMVVDDGSADTTADEARAMGVEVLSLRPNRGKGGAMREAVRHTSAPWVMFVDADLIGWSAEHGESLIHEARPGQYGMVMGTFTQGGTALEEAYAMHGFDLTGQRVVHRSVLDRLPVRYWEGYGIEVGLDEACARMGYAARRIMLPGLRFTTQREKLGPAQGFRKTTSILTEALRAAGAVRGDSSW